MMLSKIIKKPAAVTRGFNIQLLSLYHQDTAHHEYTATPTYPPILDMCREARKARRNEVREEKMKNLPTIEQKMIELNMPRYYGHWSCHIKDNKPLLLSAGFCQYATRTHLKEGLPGGLEGEYYSDVWKDAEAAADQVAGQVEQLINLNYNTLFNSRVKNSDSAQSRHQTQNFLYGLHRVLSGALQNNTHIREAMVDLRPRVESYWILGGLPADNMIKKIRRGAKRTKNMENDPIDRSIQGMSNPCLGVRVEDGLPEVVSREDALATAGEVPENTVDPRAIGFRFRHKHATTVTGSWPSEGRQHGHLFLHSREFELPIQGIYGQHNLKDAFIHKAVIAAFTQAHAHATYLGFGPITELTYPLVQQSVFTDGQRWNLGLYQLNTCALYGENAVKNPYNNILWLSEEQQLFEGVDSDGVKGLNTSLLTSILAMYLKKGVTNPDPTPYLSLKYVSNHPAREDYRENFHKFYMRLTSNRPHARPKPEMYLWERIYKVLFKTRPMEPPRRFFENHYNQRHPGQQRLDEYPPVYVPKSLREKKWIKFKPKLNTEHLYKYD